MSRPSRSRLSGWPAGRSPFSPARSRGSWPWHLGGRASVYDVIDLAVVLAAAESAGPTAAPAVRQDGEARWLALQPVAATSARDQIVRVDAVVGVQERPRAAFRALPGWVSARCELRCVRGMVDLSDGATVALIDVRDLLAAPRSPWRRVCASAGEGVR